MEGQNRECRFRKGVAPGSFQVLAYHKQAVAWGVHADLRAPYVWSRNILTPDDVPIVHVDDWAKIYEEIVGDLEAMGWAMESGQRAVPASAPSPSPASQPFHILSSLEDIKEILAFIPNDPQKSSKELAEFLDNYHNYIEIGYAICGALGKGNDARDVWLTWAHCRSQTPSDHPETTWNSIVRQSVRSGVMYLASVANRFSRGERAAHMFGSAPDVPDGPNDPGRKALKDLMDNWAYAYKPDAYVNLVTGEAISRPSFNAHLAIVVPEVHVAIKGYALKKRQRLPKMSDLFDTLPKPKCRSLTYAPGDPPLMPVKHGEFDINKWRASPHGYARGVTETQVTPWLEHIDFILGAGERERFLRWSAYLVQRPERKPNWHWLVMSIEGLGKDRMLDPVRLAVGEDNSWPLSVLDLGREFNPYAEKKFIIISETKQVNTAMNSAHDTYAVRLKPLLSSPPETLVVNRKNRPEFEVPNRHAVFMFSNERNPLWLGDNSRRVHVIDRMNEPVRHPSYYNHLIRVMEGGVAQLAASYLRYYPLPADIDTEMRGAAPSTPAKQMLEAMNRDPLRDALEEIVIDARGGAIFPTLLATVEDFIGLLQGRGLKANTMTVNSRLRGIDGVTPVAPSDKGHIGPGPAKARRGLTWHTKRLWRLGDVTHDGVDLTQMNLTDLVLFYVNGTPPKSASVTPLVKAKLAQAPVSTAPFIPDPNEDV